MAGSTHGPELRERARVAVLEQRGRGFRGDRSPGDAHRGLQDARRGRRRPGRRRVRGDRRRPPARGPARPRRALRARRDGHPRAPRPGSAVRRCCSRCSAPPPAPAGTGSSSCAPPRASPVAAPARAPRRPRLHDRRRHSGAPRPSPPLRARGGAPAGYASPLHPLDQLDGEAVGDLGLGLALEGELGRAYPPARAVRQRRGRRRRSRRSPPLLGDGTRCSRRRRPP